MTMKNDRSIITVNLMRFLMGFLLALGLFLLELGISQIVLSNDARCRGVVQSGRLLSDPGEECLSEGVYYLMVALSRGPFVSAHSTVQAPIAWITTGVVYGILGGILSVVTRRLAIGIFLGIHALVVVVLTFVAYLSNYMA
jgi:hypothetical protein